MWILDGHEADFVIFSSAALTVTSGTPVVMIHPALGTPGKYYERLSKKLVLKNGWVVANQEMRGHGSSSWIASSSQNWSYWTSPALDFDLHMAIVKSLYPTQPIFAFGHSAGGILWTLWMAKMAFAGKTHGLAGFISVASGSVYYRVLEKSMSAWLLGVWVWSTSAAIGWFPGTKLGFGGEREAKHFIQDWTHNILYGHWQPHGCPIPDISTKWFKEVHIPACFISIDQDQYTPHASTIAFMEMFPKGSDHTHIKVTAKDDPELCKLELPQLHHKWARGDSFIPYISDWVNSKLPSSSFRNTPAPMPASNALNAVEYPGKTGLPGTLHSELSSSLTASAASACDNRAKL